MSLYSFQQDAITKLQKESSRLVGDEQGLGKTVTAIELDRKDRQVAAQNIRKTLIVAPLSVLDVWERHLKEWGCNIPIYRINPKSRTKFVKALHNKDSAYYVMHWDALRLIPELRKATWFHVIADECHRAKNRKAQQTRALKRIKAQYKTGLSGTPAHDKPDDLWSILNWLHPSTYTSYWRFFHRYTTSENWTGYYVVTGVQNQDRLQKEMEPWFIRRLKQDVYSELPDKYYTNINVDLYPQQRKAYDHMKKDMIAWIGEREDEPLTAAVVVAQLIRLQQFAVAYGTIDEDNKLHMSSPSSKIDTAVELITEHPGKFVVYSQSKQAVQLLHRALEYRGKEAVTFTGDVTYQERDQRIKEFQFGSAEVFIATIGAGSEGITLTAADKVIFLDRSWNPSTNKQAEDRLHRIGQKNAVQVFDLIANNTIDLGRHQKLIQKWTWLRELIGS